VEFAALVLLVGLLGPWAAPSRLVVDDFERRSLEGGTLVWQTEGTWAIAAGRLVARYRGRSPWPHAVASAVPPRAIPAGGLVAVDIIHGAQVRRPGYAALRLTDSASGAYIEVVSNCNDTTVGYRTSATDPKILPLPGPPRWWLNQPGRYAIRWCGEVPGTGESAFEILFSPRSGANLALLAKARVKGFQAPSLVELVVNSEDQARAAASVAFDNLTLEVSQGPDTPADFAATATPHDTVRLTWQDVAAESHYVLQRAAGRGDWEEIARPPANAIAWEDRHVRPSVQYRYRLRAENARGVSNWAPEAVALVPGPPLAPDRLTATVRDFGMVILRWRDNSANEQRFVIERREAGEWRTLKTVAANVESVEDWLPASGRAAYRLRAVNALGASPWSNVAEAVLPEPSPRLLKPCQPLIYNRADQLPVEGVELVFDKPVVPPGADAPLAFRLRALRHPWHRGAKLPEARITGIVYDGPRVRIRFVPPIPDMVEYRLEQVWPLKGPDGRAVWVPAVRVAVLLGDEDRDGFVEPAPGAALGKRLPMPPMPIGIMAEDVEWHTEDGAHNVEHIIGLMDAYAGIDFFRVNVWWDLLEPRQGNFDPTYLGFLRRVLEAAQRRQLPMEVGLRQVRWPLWVCNHGGFSNRLYDPRVAPKLAETWRRLAEFCHRYPVVFGYWPISEEYPKGGDIPNYLTCMNRVAEVLRKVHPGCVVKLRPADSPFRGGHEVTPIVTQRGPQDICMAAGVYPSGWQWDIANPTPLSTASFTNMEAFRYYAPEVQGGPNGLGEIGFRAAAGSSFGDPERLLAFERVMALAYDIGLEEFVIWGEAWTFSDPATYFPRLVAFRDALVRRPRHPGFDLRLVNDKAVNFAHPPYTKVANPDLSHIFRWLEERGYKFFITVPAAMRHQKEGQFKVSVNISELLALPRGEQLTFLERKLADVEPTGIILPWLGRRSYRQSITGLPCDIEIEFPDAQGTCDAVSLGPSLVQIYAPSGTLVRWRRPGESQWHDFTMPPDTRITFLQLEPSQAKPRERPPAGSTAAARSRGAAGSSRPPRRR